MKKAEYMESYIGEVFVGTVTSIRPFGIFVGLPNTVEGLIKKDSLHQKGFNYNNQGYFEHFRDNKKISLGDTVKIKVSNASKILSEIDFDLVYNNGGVKRYGRKNKNYRKK